MPWHRFRRLLVSPWASDLGEGVALVAGPLLVVSQTREPFVIALATMLQRVAWLVFGLHAGVGIDRLDRRRIIVAANAARAAVQVLSTMIVTETVTAGVVLVALTMLGTAEVFVDTTSSTMLAMIAGRDDLGLANSRLMFGRLTINRLGGPAVGAGPFAAGIVVAFVVHAVCVRCACGVRAVRGGGDPQHRRRPAAADRALAATRGDRRRAPPGVASSGDPHADDHGLRVQHHLRCRAGDPGPVHQQLGLGEVGFGLLTSCGAAGGILIALSYGRIERRLGAATVVRVGLTIEVLMHLTFALDTSVTAAFAALFVFGVHDAAWGMTSTTIRRRVVPAEFQGRVSSVNGVGAVGVFSALVVGSLLGGAIASRWGATGPYWFGFVGSLVTLATV